MRKGLATSEALQKLYEHIRQATDDDEKEKEINISQFLNLFNPKLLNWPLQYSRSWHSFERITLIMLVLEILALVITYIFHPGNSTQGYLAEAFLLTALGALNVLFLWWDDQLRRTEMRTRARWILDFLQEVHKKCQWRPEHYPNIHSPQSPSISLQPTIRDGNIVNLPWALLVEGDVIILRPGQAAPGRCRSIDDGTVLECEEVFAPANEDETESFTIPRLRKPLQCLYCVLEETPFINSLRIMLKEALNRPNSVFQKEKYLIFTICLEHVMAPTFLVVLTVLNIVRYLYSSAWLSTGHWTEMFLIEPCSVILPLIPLVLPVAWLIINAFGLAWILALFYTARQYKVSNDPFEEAEVTSPTHSTFWGKCREMRPYFVDTLLGRGKSPFRTANLLQTLASVTALCCVDKKGILSWPNPTAEKVFFLRNATQGFQDVTPVSSSPDQSTASVQETLAERKAHYRRRKRSHAKSDYGSETTAEVLDLSHDCTAPFRLQFDDPSWKQYIDSLKPLGLAILLNTCNPQTQERYAQFCSHLSCLSLRHEDLIPVTNRRDCNGDDRVQSCVNDVCCTTPTPARTTVSHVAPMPIMHGCLCELAKQIGFSAGARDIFSLKDELFTYRHQADLARKDRLARSLSLPKLKFPFPNMVGICVQESSSGRLQLLSQGTGEILLDSCVDYWNGSDLCPLTVADRKRILDFYNRTSLTAYCTAFAYRPLTNRLNFNTGYRQGCDCQPFESTGVYLELPADSGHLYQPQRSPTPVWDSTAGSSVHSHGVRIHSDGNLYNLGTGFLSRSNDSLLANDSATESAEPIDDAHSAENMFQVQCNQTFVAMVTMQYQARTDMVQLIEQLDQACIRFVHFSKENELRSRVFSEKMGLESGWNCHISLLSEGNEGRPPVDGEATVERKRHKSIVSLVGKDRDDFVGATGKGLEHSRPLSVSAPSAINMEMAQVKFEEEISLHSLTADSDEESELEGEEAERQRLFTSPQTLNVQQTALQTPSPHRHQLAAGGSSECLGSLGRCSSRSSSSSSSSSSVLINVEGGGSSCWDVNLSRSQSHVTESTEQSAPVAFDLSNRAKLPRGIEEIRPHIERVDNVPLLVSLFTDCTPDATREMIQIMQENGEVVCIIGSSASSHNSAIFMQADASLAVEPLYPQVCQQVNVYSPVADASVPSPVELSRRLNSLPCALSFHRDELPSSLLHLVLESRHVGLCLRNVLQLWAATSISLSALQLGAALLFLPPVLTTGQVLWLSCVTVPILSTSMMGAPTDSRVMNIATGKNIRTVDREMLSFVAWSYGLKFAPSILVLLFIYCTTLMDLCGQLAGADGACFLNDSLAFDSCLWVYPSRNGSVVATSLWSGWGQQFQPLYFKIQHCIALAFVLYMVFVSMSFIHRHSHLWQRNPLKNRLWIICSAFVIGLQAIYFSVAVWLDEVNQGAIVVDPSPPHGTPDQCALHRLGRFSWDEVPLPLWLGIAWPVLLVAFNELVKYYEIKMNVRLQKRARLEFGTKLGMNSPF